MSASKLAINNPVFEYVKEATYFNITLEATNLETRKKVCKYVHNNLKKLRGKVGDDEMDITYSTPDDITSFLTTMTYSIDNEYYVMEKVLDNIKAGIKKFQVEECEENTIDDDRILTLIYRRGGVRTEAMYKNGECLGYKDFTELVPYKMDVRP